MPYYVVDSFTDTLFHGNPAGVCVLDSWPSEALMQSIAAENNLSETAFVVAGEDGFDLRWFTPGAEVDLCGHATLATAFVLFSFHAPEAHVLRFHTQSGLLTVRRDGALLEMDFPARPVQRVDLSALMEAAVDQPIKAAYGGYNLLFELADEASVAEAVVDYAAICQLLPYDGLIITAAGSDCDFVSRYFAPHVGIDEDPVTGSTHTALCPFWSERLGKKELTARQLSKRGGLLYCRNEAERVFISGQARLYLKGELQL